MDGMTYRVKIRLEGFEFEAEGDKEFVVEMLDRYDRDRVNGRARLREGASDSAQSAAEQQTSLAPMSTKNKSLREFVQMLQFKKHTDFVIAFGYYLEKYSGLEQFTAADLNECYYEAKLEPSNTSQAIIQNIKRGFLMAAKGGESARNAYTLTSTGEGFITTRLDPANA